LGAVELPARRLLLLLLRLSTALQERMIDSRRISQQRMTADDVTHDRSARP